MMKNLDDQNLIDALKKVRGLIPRVMDVLGLDRHKEADTWAQIIDKKLLTKLSPDFPLMVTICGGGSSGKSTLFNSIAKEGLSPVGGSAGLNRRVLFSAHGELLEKPDFLSTLFEPFGRGGTHANDAQRILVLLRDHGGHLGGAHVDACSQPDLTFHHAPLGAGVRFVHGGPPGPRT